VTADLAHFILLMWLKQMCYRRRFKSCMKSSLTEGKISQMGD